MDLSRMIADCLGTVKLSSKRVIRVGLSESEMHSLNKGGVLDLKTSTY